MIRAMTIAAGLSQGRRKAPDILVPSFEREILRMNGAEERSPKLLSQLDENLRLAILFSENSALVPAPGFFETECGFTVIQRFTPSMERGQLELFGSGGSPSAYAERKLQHWAGDQTRLALYRDVADERIAAVGGGAWRIKTTATDEHLRRIWQQSLDGDRHPLLSLWRRTNMSAAKLEQDLCELPDRLDGTALLVDNVTQCLNPELRSAVTSLDRHALRIFLAQGFFKSYLEEGHAVALSDARLGGNAALPMNAPSLTQRQLTTAMEPLGLNDPLLREWTVEQLAELISTAVWQSMAANLRARAIKSPAYSANELIALGRVRKPRRRRGASATVDSVKQLLRQQLQALDKAARGKDAFRPGASRGPRGWASTDNWKGEPMGTKFTGPTYNFGPVINAEEGDVFLASSPPGDVLEAALPRVLGARAPMEAVQMVASLEKAIGQRNDITSREVAEVVEQKFADQARRMPDRIKQALIDLGTETSAGVVAQGIVLGLTALAGG